MLRGLIALCAAGLLVGCGGFVHDEQLDEDYSLVAVDDLDDMMVCRRLDRGSCSGDSLPGPTVFAAGSNDRHIVIARNPNRGTGPDKRVTEYFYVTKRAKGVPLQAGDSVGPMSQPEFEAATRRLGLPPLSKTIRELR